MTLSWFGLKGWQTMYVVQGLLTVAIGLGIPFMFPNRVRRREMADTR